jgi:hypothetical protein
VDPGGDDRQELAELLLTGQADLEPGRADDEAE